MIVIFKSDGDGLEIQVAVRWDALRSTLKALIPVIAALLSLLAAPEIARLGSYFGWW